MIEKISVHCAWYPCTSCVPSPCSILCLFWRIFVFVHVLKKVKTTWYFVFIYVHWSSLADYTFRPPASLNWNARYCKFIHPFLFPFLNSVLIHTLYPKDLNTFAQQGFGKSEISFDSDSKSENFLAFYTQKCHAFYVFSHNHINIITKKYQSFFRSPAVN